MAYAMTKRGSQDNIITYEFICDNIIDMNTIENKYRTLGSVAVVLQGESDGLEVYIAGSNHQWYSLGALGMSDGGNDTTGFSFYICEQNEVSNGLPDISEPSESTIYLVPATDTATNDLFVEYIWTGTAWEKFGAKTATIDLSGYATKQEIAGFYTKPQSGIPAADLADTYLTQQDISGLAPKASPVFTGSISMGRKSGTTSTGGSVAIGLDAEATGSAGTTSIGMYTKATGRSSHAEGQGTYASGWVAHAEGLQTRAEGDAGHAEGYHTNGTSTRTINNVAYTFGASGTASHSEGESTIAAGTYSHAEGRETIALGANSHVGGQFNVPDNWNDWTEWVANTEYEVGDLVKLTLENKVKAYKCRTANSDAEFTSDHWYLIDGQLNYAEIIGNGTDINNRSNARVLDWNGNEYLKGDVYVGCNADSTGGTKLATISQIPDTSLFAPKASPVFTESISMSRKANTTIGLNSVAIGGGVTATGIDSFAEGSGTIASANDAHAEGYYTTASGIQAHAEGMETIASGVQSHAEGVGGTYTNNGITYTSEAAGAADHTEGYKTRTAVGQPGNHAEGYQTAATGGAAHAEGNATLASGIQSHAEGSGTVASGTQSHAEGYQTIASELQSHAEGTNTVASSQSAHSEGAGTTASGANSHAEGGGTTASGANSHVEGGGTLASGIQSHAEGTGTIASGMSSHAEGSSSSAIGGGSHAEGGGTTAKGNTSHAEGSGTAANGNISHAEGYNTVANGESSHVGGMYNIPDSHDSWTEWVSGTEYEVGDKVKVTTIVDNESVTKGYICKTENSDAEFTVAKWNEDHKMNYIEIIGNGTANDARSNAYALGWDGTGHFSGDVYVGCNANSTGGSKVATETALNALIARVAALETEVQSLRTALTPEPGE